MEKGQKILLLAVLLCTVVVLVVLAVNFTKNEQAVNGLRMQVSKLAVTPTVAPTDTATPSATTTPTTGVRKFVSPTRVSPTLVK